MDIRDPLEVRWDDIHKPEHGLSLDTEIQPWTNHTDRRRAIQYYLECRRAANSKLLRDIDRDTFLEELQERIAPSVELLQSTVQAFVCAALRLPDAQTADGWRKVLAAVSTMLRTAMQLGYTEARPIAPRTGPVPRVPSAPPLPPWAIVAFESRRPTKDEIEADLAYWKGLPVRLLETLIRAYLNARYRTDEAATPEGRSRIMAGVREVVWDAVLDAVKIFPCPVPRQSTPPPGLNLRAPKRPAP
jgi:hypothetical protein